MEEGWWSWKSEFDLKCYNFDWEQNYYTFLISILSENAQLGKRTVLKSKMNHALFFEKICLTSTSFFFKTFPYSIIFPILETVGRVPNLQPVFIHKIERETTEGKLQSVFRLIHWLSGYEARQAWLEFYSAKHAWPRIRSMLMFTW